MFCPVVLSAVINHFSKTHLNYIKNYKPNKKFSLSNKTKQG